MAQFETIHTLYGLRRMNAAAAANVAINLTHMAIGDGNGNAFAPNELQTQLVGEKWRGRVNRVYSDPANPTMFTAELIVPAAIGGFTLRGVAIFDADGGMFAVGNLPESYKPTLDEGSFGDIGVRIQFLVTNAAVVTLQVDPNIAVATQTWITNNITADNLFPGGTAGQLLSRKENGRGHEWINPGAVSVSVNGIEEVQELAANQTTVTLTKTTTRGLSVYIGNGIGGGRIAKGAGVNGWTVADSGASMTKIVLGKAYAAGTMILLAQNEPNGSTEAPLVRAANLSDLQDPAVARVNLDVYNKAEVDQQTPVGEIKLFPFATAPLRFLKANGAAISRTAYAKLFAAIGTTFGDGDGYTTFNVPDLRGEFLRCWDDGRGIDAGRALGSTQASQNQEHTHEATAASAGSHSHSYTDTRETSTGASGAAYGSGFTNKSYSATTGSDGSHKHTITVAATGGTEARPRNVAMLACIRF